jgi:hypothetical protein
MAVDANTSQIKSATSGEASNEAKPPSYLPKEYNKKARQYIGLMTAIPVFLVLSYVLYERCGYPSVWNNAFFVRVLTQDGSDSRKGEEGAASISRRDEFESKIEIKIKQFFTTLTFGIRLKSVKAKPNAVPNNYSSHLTLTLA